MVFGPFPHSPPVWNPRSRGGPLAHLFGKISSSLPCLFPFPSEGHVSAEVEGPREGPPGTLGLWLWPCPHALRPSPPPPAHSSWAEVSPSGMGEPPPPATSQLSSRSCFLHCPAGAVRGWGRVDGGVDRAGVGWGFPLPSSTAEGSVRGGARNAAKGDWGSTPYLLTYININATFLNRLGDSCPGVQVGGLWMLGWGANLPQGSTPLVGWEGQGGIVTAAHQLCVPRETLNLSDLSSTALRSQLGAGWGSTGVRSWRLLPTGHPGPPGGPFTLPLSA